MAIDPRHKPYLALTLLAVVLGLAFQGTRGLFDTSEGRYAECAREMVETGNWLEPQLNYEPHWTKPPPTYWAIAAGMMMLGQNEWGVRLYGAAAFVVSVLAVAALGSAMWDRRTGLVAGLIYATSPFAIGAANVVTADCLLSMWTLLAVLAYWRATRAAGNRAAWLWIVAMWLALALGFATKGPPALLVLIPIIVVRLWPAPPESPRTRILSPVALAASALVGLAIFAGVGLGWYAWAAATHPGLLDTFLGKEVVGRMFTNEFERNPEWYEPLIKYLPLMVLGPGLWIVFYRDLWRLAGPRLRRLWQTGRSNERATFLLAWCVVPLIILSLSSSRMYLYVLPIFPPVVLALARSLVHLQESRPRSTRYWTVVAALAVVIVLGGKATFAYMPLAKDTRPFYELSRRLAPDDRRFVILCDQNEKCALMFYQKGRMMQVEPTGDVAVAQPRYDRIVSEIRRRAAEGPVLVIMRTYNEQLKQTIDAAGIGYTEHTGLRKRVVLLIDRSTVTAPTD